MLYRGLGSVVVLTVVVRRIKMFTLGLEGCLSLILGCAMIVVIGWMIYDEVTDK